MKIGILGGGQLGRMLALAGYPLGMSFRFLDPSPEAPAGQMAEHIVGDYDNEPALARFLEGLDVVTFEFENVPVETARAIARKVPVYPPPQALETSQDRLVEKRFFRSLGIPTPPFEPVSSLDELRAAAAQLGLPAVLKTRRMGYDGKGQYLLRGEPDIEQAWQALGSVPLILEGFVQFSRELSVIAVRGHDGQTVCYPLVENTHREGILRTSIAPASVDPGAHASAEEYAHHAMQALDYRGVLAIELFDTGSELIANEMAPRVHNSGHWTIEGAETSQFENHLRAVAGLPLGSRECVSQSAMLNLIGTVPKSEDVLSVPGAHLHLYGKAPRPGRKLGHITLRADDKEKLAAGLADLRRIVDRS